MVNYKSVLRFKNRFNLIFIFSLFFLVIFTTPVFAELENSQQEQETILISQLEIGAKIIDNNWEWEFKTGNYYTGTGETKPVIWKVVSHDHPGFPDNKNIVTLVSEEPIATHKFDDTNNTWDACEARRFLTEVFYDNFTTDFKRGVANTLLPYWDIEGNSYKSRDKVFILSFKELGLTNNDLRDPKLPIQDKGMPLEYFKNNSIINSGIDTIITRTLVKDRREYMKTVVINNRADYITPDWPGAIIATLNIRNSVEVFAEPNEDNLYSFASFPFLPGDVNGDGAINVTDAILILRHIVDITRIDGESLIRAKVSDDGSDFLTVTDAILVLRYVVGLIFSFPVEN